MGSQFRRVAAAAALTVILASTGYAQSVLSDLKGKVKGERTITVEAPGATSVGCTLDGYPCSGARKITVAHDRANIDIDFGSIPFPRTLTITAYDAVGGVLGIQRHHVNPGGRAAYIDFLEPMAAAKAPSGTSIVACVHTASGDEIADARITANDTLLQTAIVTDRRCDGTALSATLPADAVYLEANATTTRGKTLIEPLIVNQDPRAFGDVITVQLMQYLVRPVDRDGATVGDLPQERFHVREDRRELPILKVAPVADAPLDIAIILDASASTFGDTAMEQSLVDAVLKLFDPTKDRAIVYAISTYPEAFLPDWTSDHATIEKALRSAMRLKPGFTSAYETLEDVLHQFQSSSRDGASAGAIIYMTDGSDSFDDKVRREERLLRYARASGIQVYPISISLPVPVTMETQCMQKAVNGMADEYLDALASATGGERTRIKLEANPVPFLKEAEKLALEIKRLNERLAGETQKDTKRRLEEMIDAKRRCLEIDVSEYERQEAMKLSSQPAERVAEAIARAGTSLRSQYVVAFQTAPDNRPRERQLTFEVADPRVNAVRSSTGVRY